MHDSRLLTGVDPSGHYRSELQRFGGVKLTVRPAYCNLDEGSNPTALPPHYAPAMVLAALQVFRREALPHLVQFVRERLVSDETPPVKIAELKRQVAQHSLVATFVMPLEYGGTLHHHNMALMPDAQAAQYHRLIVRQVESARLIEGKGASESKGALRHVLVQALPELGKNDYARFILPQQGDRLLLPLQEAAALMLHRKPPSRYSPMLRQAYRAAAREAQERVVGKRADRHNTNQQIRSQVRRFGMMLDDVS